MKQESTSDQELSSGVVGQLEITHVGAQTGSGSAIMPGNATAGAIASGTEVPVLAGRAPGLPVCHDSVNRTDCSEDGVRQLENA